VGYREEDHSFNLVIRGGLLDKVAFVLSREGTEVISWRFLR
jgi:hypothetical protein